MAEKSAEAATSTHRTIPTRTNIPGSIDYQVLRGIGFKNGNPSRRGREGKAASCGPGFSNPKSKIEIPKLQRVAAFAATLGVEARDGLDPRYLGYFTLFNQARYYEAHDVLEHLWLECEGGERPFYQALIQVAGAFVHLQKQRARPLHPTDGRRLRPAERLLRLAVEKLDGFRPECHSLDVDGLCAFCTLLADDIASGGFQKNPWRAENAPQLRLRSSL